MKRQLEEILADCRLLLECKYDWDYVCVYLNDLARGKDITWVENGIIREQLIKELHSQHC